MAKVNKNLRLYFGPLDLSGTANAVSIDHGVDVLDDTTIGDETRSNIAGLKTTTLGISGNVDLAALGQDSAMFAAVGGADFPVSWCDGPTEGALAYFINTNQGSYSPGGAMGEIFKFDANCYAVGDLAKGLLMDNKTATATANGTGRNLGAVAAGKKLVAAAHVYGVTGTTPSLGLIVQSATSSGFSSPTTQLTFDPFTTIGSQYKEVAGPITDTWFRVRRNAISGTSPSFQYVVFLAIV